MRNARSMHARRRRGRCAHACRGSTYGRRGYGLASSHARAGAISPCAQVRVYLLEGTVSASVNDVLAYQVRLRPPAPFRAPCECATSIRARACVDRKHRAREAVARVR
jgi:hypothetical protein